MAKSGKQCLADTKLVSLLTAVVVFVAALWVTALVSCNVHELTHLVVGRAFGLPLHGVVWCWPLPTGEVRWVANENSLRVSLTNYGGGIISGGLLVAVYWIGLLAKGRVAENPNWCAVGLVVAIVAAVQVLTGVIEGTWPATYQKWVLSGGSAYRVLQGGSIALALVIHAYLVWQALHTKTAANR
jgi:hypothetical protein